MKLISMAPALLALAALSSPAKAAESFDNCRGFITHLPATISTQGVWCLDRDLGAAIASGTAIVVTTNNVTIDCNGYKVGGLSAGPSTAAIGILADARHNVTVRGCNVRGFHTGIALSGSGHVVEDNNLNANTAIGVQVVGDGSIVRRNLVLDTGGSTHASSLDKAIGIDTAYNVDVLDNTIDSVEATGTAGGVKHGIGIRTEYNTAATIARNRVRVVIAAGGGDEIGIQNLASGRLTLLDNILSGMSGGYGDGTGIVCEGSNGVAVRNIMNGYATGLDGCVNSGGNVHML